MGPTPEHGHDLGFFERRGDRPLVWTTKTLSMPDPDCGCRPTGCRAGTPQDRRSSGRISRCCPRRSVGGVCLDHDTGISVPSPRLSASRRSEVGVVSTCSWRPSRIGCSSGWTTTAGLRRRLVNVSSTLRALARSCLAIRGSCESFDFTPQLVDDSLGRRPGRTAPVGLPSAPGSGSLIGWFLAVLHGPDRSGAAHRTAPPDR